LFSRNELCRISLALRLQDFLQHTDEAGLLIGWLLFLRSLLMMSTPPIFRCLSRDFVFNFQLN
jgi:hypothetical protein